MEVYHDPDESPTENQPISCFEQFIILILCFLAIALFVFIAAAFTRYIYELLF